MAKILYEVKRNQNSYSQAYGKWYAQIKSLETLNTRKLANHISEHGSIYTPDVVYGVLEKFRSCLVEMLLESKKVKIEGLGTFYCTLENQKNGALKKEDFNVNKHLKALHIRFLPEQTTEENISSREFLKKAEFINIDSLLKSDESENGGDSTGGSSQNGGSGNGGSNTGGGTGSVTPSNGGNSGSVTSSTPKLTISRSGNGTSSVTANGNTVNSGSELQAGTEVSIRITPAEGKIPTAMLNGNTVALTENGGAYTGSFQMPSSNANLVINSGYNYDNDAGDMN